MTTIKRYAIVAMAILIAMLSFYVLEREEGVSQGMVQSPDIQSLHPQMFGAMVDEVCRRLTTFSITISVEEGVMAQISGTCHVPVPEP